MVSGDTKKLRVRVIQPDRSPYSLAEMLTGVWKVAKTVKATAVITKTMADDQITPVQDGENWYIEIDLEAADTEDLSGSFYHECQITKSDGTVATPFSGTVTIKEDLV